MGCSPNASMVGSIPYVTSTTRPTGSDLYAGLLIYELDTNHYWRYTGSAWVALPFGSLGGHSLSTAFVTTGTHTTFQDEGLTKTVDDVAGIRYMFTLSVQPYVSGGVNRVQYRLLRDGVTMRTWDLTSASLSTTEQGPTTLTYSEVVAVTHAASVYKVQIAGVLNTAVNSHGAAGYPRQLLIEDLGSL